MHGKAVGESAASVDKNLSELSRQELRNAVPGRLGKCQCRGEGKGDFPGHWEGSCSGITGNCGGQCQAGRALIVNTSHGVAHIEARSRGVGGLPAFSCPSPAVPHPEELCPQTSSRL